LNQVIDDNRLSTGVAGLDVLLDGGLVRGGVYLIMGNPGTGKTTLGNQVAFAHVASGGRAAYVTLLAETHSRMLGNLQHFDFFRPEIVGRSLFYVGGYLVLREKRLSGLLQMLRRVLQDERPTLLVLDGIASVHSLGESEAALKEFIAELQVMTEMSGCTTLILANVTPVEATGPEHSMVDGLIDLRLVRSVQRTFREIEVLKFRSAHHYLGSHELEIDSSRGIVVRPRIEHVFARRQSAPGDTQYLRVSTGIPNLDHMLGGGYLAGSTTMLLGFTGSGKTMLALHFLDAGARAGENGLHFGFYEAPSRLIEAAEHVRLPLHSHQREGLVDIVWQQPLRYSLDALAERLFDNVERRSVRRVVIDGLDGLRQSANYPERSIRFVTAMVNELRARNVTVLITEETLKMFGPEVEVRVEGMSALVENTILLEYLDVGSELRRLLSVVKQRGSGYDAAVRELCITDHGITLAEDAVSARGIMMGSTEGRKKLRTSSRTSRAKNTRRGHRGRAR
jgi:circadian clock protein KaiC